MSAPRLEIERVDVAVGDHSVVYDSRANITVKSDEGESVSGVGPCGATAMVAISFDVDGQLDFVHVELFQQGDLETLDRAIGALTLVRGQLDAMYGDRPRRVGRCYAQGEYGQCKKEADHAAGDHDFEIDPSSRALMTQQEALEAARTPWSGSWKK